MKHYAVFALVLMGLLSGGSSTVFGDNPADKIPWKKVKEKDGIEVFRREIPGSPVLAFKGAGVVNAPIALVATVINDASRGTEWVEDLTESRILRWISKDDFIEYDHVATPFVMKDRDFVSVVKTRGNPTKKSMSISYASVDDPGAPVTSFVRGDLLNTTFLLQSTDNGTKTYLEADILCDPKGSVPKWIVNFFQEDWPVDTFKSLRKQVAKPDVHTNPKFSSMLGLDKS